MKVVSAKINSFHMDGSGQADLKLAGQRKPMFSSGTGWDCSEFQKVFKGLVGVPLGAGGIGQMSFRSGWDWFRFLWEQVGLEKSPSGMGGIG